MMRLVLSCTLTMLMCVGLVQDESVGAWRHADDKSRQAALNLARHAFEAYVTNRTIVDQPSGLPELLIRRSGVFVSAMRNGAPRCCMGTLYPTEANTALEIISSSVSAAGRDHRFPPIKPKELKDLVLIVSIVGQPRPIDISTLSSIDPANEGIAVKFRDRYGVTLSGETGDTDRMLKWARIRAGASPNSSVQLFRLDDVRLVERP